MLGYVFLASWACACRAVLRARANAKNPNAIILTVFRFTLFSLEFLALGNLRAELARRACYLTAPVAQTGQRNRRTSNSFNADQLRQLPIGVWPI